MNSRRHFLKQSASLAAALSIGEVSPGAAETKSAVSRTTAKKVKWPVLEGPDTPKLALNCPSNASQARMRMHKQFGDDYILMGGPPLPWTVSGLREIMDRF
jgi:mannonate dehydratase